MESKPPAVTCTSCERTWMSASMAEGLRLLGACPRCGGALNFAEGDAKLPAVARITPEDAVAMAPHMVMGIPRR
jgi:hypothetical protein